MENIQDSCPLLRLLRLTKFGITDSQVQASNRYKCNPTLVSFIESLKNITTENCIPPEHMAMYQVCKENKFKSKCRQFDNARDLKPISSVDIKCLEREIQNKDRVLAEKRNLLLSLKSDISHLEDSAIPKGEDRLKQETKNIEKNLASFLELNVQLNSEYNRLKQNTQQMLSEEQNKNGYHKYNFHDALYHLMKHMNTDFYVMCKYLQSNNTQCTIDHELDIELIGKSLAHLTTQLLKSKCKSHAHLRCKENLERMKHQLEQGTFKFNMLEISRDLKSSSQMTSKLSTAWVKVSSQHTTQACARVNSVYISLCTTQLTRLDCSLQLLHNLDGGVRCLRSLLCVLLMLVDLERGSQDLVYAYLSRAHAGFERLYASLMKQESNLKQLPEPAKLPQSLAQCYATQLIAQSLSLPQCEESLESAWQVLEDTLYQEKFRIQEEYCAGAVYKKLNALRDRMKRKASHIYAGPCRVPNFPYKPHTDLAKSVNLQLSKLRMEYANLIRDIQETGDSGISTFASDFSL